MNRRSRVILFAERTETLLQFKSQTNRSLELITASDLATVEAALRVYAQVDSVVVEKSGESKTALKALALAEQLHPHARRVLIVECEAMTGVYTAVRDGSVAELLFLPLEAAQVRDLLGLDAAGTAYGDVLPPPTRTWRADAISALGRER